MFSTWKCRNLIHLMEGRFRATHSTTRRSSACRLPVHPVAGPAAERLQCTSATSRAAECRSTRLNRLVCRLGRGSDTFRRQAPTHDPNGRNLITCCVMKRGPNELTFEYIKLSGRLIAIDRSHTKKIFSTTRLRVLLRPKRIGYRSDRYRSIEIVQRCMMLAVQKRTSKQIQARQCSDCSGKYPRNWKEMFAIWLEEHTQHEFVIPSHTQRKRLLHMPSHSICK